MNVDDRVAEYAEAWKRSAALPSPALEFPTRRAPRALLAGAAAAAVVAAAFGVAVAVRRDEPHPAALTRIADADLDRFSARDAAFFAPFRAASGASEAEQFGSLRETFLGAAAVVVARVVDVRATRTVPGDGAETVTYVGVVLRPVEVLRGELRTSRSDLVVEFAGDVAAVRDSVPSGYGVWFLRNKGDIRPGVTPKPGAPVLDEAAYYRLVSSQGLFVQGSLHVVNPVRSHATPEAESPTIDPELDGPRDPVAREGEAFRTLSALVAHLRSIA
jgi:hypothetical protein